MLESLARTLDLHPHITAVTVLFFRITATSRKSYDIDGMGFERYLFEPAIRKTAHLAVVLNGRAAEEAPSRCLF
uniref:Uncharacterized protein n=1 Tax=Anguilla anguilla TaxID=7936 RepID=A0A0E9SU36_ANGAN